MFAQKDVGARKLESPKAAKFLLYHTHIICTHHVYHTSRRVRVHSEVTLRTNISERGRERVEDDFVRFCEIVQKTAT